MASDYDRYDVAAPRPRVWLRILILCLAMFVAGAIGMGWVLTHWGAAQRYLRDPASSVAPIPVMLPRAMPAAEPSAAPLAAVPGAAPAVPALEQRLQAIEQRLGEVDRRASAAVGNVDRAEGLLIAFAARRALDRGVELGYIEGLLRSRFGASQPDAVTTIIAAAHQPVTIEQLQVGLDAAAPGLEAAGPGANWWETFRRELGAMVLVRRADAPSTAPEARIERARGALEIGRVDIALAEVARLPSRAAAADWMAQSRRYISSRGALDRIETAALLDPGGTAPSPGQQAPAQGAWTGE